MTIGIPKYSFLSKIFWIFWGFLGRKPKYKKLLISNDDKVSAEMIELGPGIEIGSIWFYRKTKNQSLL